MIQVILTKYVFTCSLCLVLVDLGVGLLTEAGCMQRALGPPRAQLLFDLTIEATARAAPPSEGVAAALPSSGTVQHSHRFLFSSHSAAPLLPVNTLWLLAFLAVTFYLGPNTALYLCGSSPARNGSVCLTYSSSECVVSTLPLSQKQTVWSPLSQKQTVLFRERIF